MYVNGMYMCVYFNPIHGMASNELKLVNQMGFFQVKLREAKMRNPGVVQRMITMTEHRI